MRQRYEYRHVFVELKGSSGKKTDFAAVDAECNRLAMEGFRLESVQEIKELESTGAYLYLFVRETT